MKKYTDEFNEKLGESQDEDVNSIISNFRHVEDIIQKKSIFKELRDTIYKMYQLLVNPRANMKTKLIITVALCYLISPLDFIPDMLPFVGYVDDIIMISLAISSIRKELQ